MNAQLDNALSTAITIKFSKKENAHSPLKACQNQKVNAHLPLWACKNKKANVQWDNKEELKNFPFLTKWVNRKNVLLKTVLCFLNLKVDLKNAQHNNALTIKTNTEEITDFANRATVLPKVVLCIKTFKKENALLGDVLCIKTFKEGSVLLEDVPYIQNLWAATEVDIILEADQEDIMVENTTEDTTTDLIYLFKIFKKNYFILL